MTVAIFHNPNCGTSRNVPALIRHAGIGPEVIEYRETAPTEERLRALVTDLGIPVRDVLREKGTPYADLGLGDPAWTDDELLDFIVRCPILMNRPIVVTSLGVALCRPSEAVPRLLPVARLPDFVR